MLRGMFGAESIFLTRNILTHMIWGGVLERHPGLTVVFTEQGSAPLDLVQAGVATGFSNCSQSVKTLDHFHLLDHRESRHATPLAWSDCGKREPPSSARR